MKPYSIIALILCLLSLNISCIDKDINNSKKYTIKGKVEKGPFVKGSKITLQTLSEDLTPTGYSFPATILDAEGSFSFGEIALETSYALLIADGYYFNELYGDLSQGQISLKALVDLSDKSTVNVNILTHLKQERVQYLYTKKKKSFKEANEQAQLEILTCFALQKYANKDVSSYSISGGNDEAGALIVTSSMLLADKSDAEFTEYITDLSQEFKNTGTFSAKHKKELRENSLHISLESIRDYVIERYKSLKKTITVPDLAYYIDWDNDGVAGNELGDKEQEKILEFETDTLKISLSGGEFKVKINTTIPCTFDFLGNPPVIVTPENPYFKTSPIKYQRSISDDNYLILNVEPSANFFMQDASVTLYSYDGGISTTLIIQQEGDISKLEDPNTNITNMITAALSNALNYTFSMEALFSQCFSPNGNPDWQVIYDHTLNGNSKLVEKAWNEAYKSVAHLNSAIHYTAGHSDYIESVFKNIRAMLYYQMVCLWKFIPYNTSDQVSGAYLKQTPSEEIYRQLQTELEECIALFPKQKNNNQIAVSRATPQMILAKIHMETGKYAEALALLEDIISDGQYTLSDSRQPVQNTRDDECIFHASLNPDMIYSQITGYNNYIPVLRYTEVLLLASECEYHLGNLPQAKSYLSKIQAKSKSPTMTEDDFINILSKTWRQEVPGEFSYFFFLRRNQLIKSTLNVTKHHTVLPIPMIQLEMNPYIIQNAEY